MKKNEKGLWMFESHDEIRDFVSQNYPTRVFLVATPYKYVVNDAVYNEGNCQFCGPLEDFTVDSFATSHNFVRRDIEAQTVLEAFYMAGDELAAGLRLSDGASKRFTATELAKPVFKGGPLLMWPEEDLEVLYTMKTSTSCYNVPADQLFDIIDHMEKVEGVSSAKRRRFAVLSEDDGGRNVVARLTFTADKLLPKLKKCWANDELRPVLNHAAIETKTGVMVASNGHILAAHKLKDYCYDGPDTLMFHDVLMPREIISMKGTVTVEIEEKTFEQTTHQDSGEDIVKKWDGLLVTATDQGGRHGEVRQDGRFPNWRSVFPGRVGKPVKVDVKGWTDGVKRVMPQLACYSQQMVMDAERGSKTVNFYGEDYDFANVTVAVPGGVKYGLLIGVRAPQMLDVLAFCPELMYYTDPTRALLFENQDTLVICMPLRIEFDNEDPRGPKDDKEFMRFDVNRWAERKPDVRGKKEDVRGKKEERPQTSAVTHPISIEDRLRTALRKQFAMAA